MCGTKLRNYVVHIMKLQFAIITLRKFLFQSLATRRTGCSSTLTLLKMTSNPKLISVDQRKSKCKSIQRILLQKNCKGRFESKLNINIVVDILKGGVPKQIEKWGKTRFSWLTCALRDDEAVYCVSIGHFERYQLVIDNTGSVEGIYAFIYCTKWRSGQVLPMPYGLTDWLTDYER